jgi:hypothetical protein
MAESDAALFSTFRTLGMPVRKTFGAQVHLGLCCIKVEKERKKAVRRTDQGAVRKFIT